MEKTDLEKKVQRAIAFLHLIPNDKPVEIAYSGGKDSDVILELVKMAGLKYIAVYKNTTIDPPGTIAYVKSRGAVVLQPRRSFFEIVKAKGMPSRKRRFCCSELKEKASGYSDRLIIGIRKAESYKRKKRYKEPEKCDPRNKGVKQYFPILDWTNDDVENFIIERGLKIHPLYYKEGGSLDVSLRLGCIGCPLASQKNRRMGYKKYPGILRACENALKEYFCDENKAYKYFVQTLFFKSPSHYEEFYSAMFEELQTTDKEILEQYFKIKL